MSASKDDYFKKVGRATATTLSSPGYTIGDSTINTGATTNWPVDTGVTFAIDEVGSDGLRISGTYNVFNGVVSGAGQVSQVEYIGGDPNRDYSAGATTRVYILVSAYRDNQFTDGILVHANQNGTLKDTAIPANSIDNSNVKTGAAINGSKLADTSIPTAKYQDGSVTPPKLSNPYKFRAYRSSAYNFSNAFTKVPFNAESFDTNNNFDSSTNNRYVAPVDGFYQFNARASTAQGSGTHRLLLALYKNGVVISRGSDVHAGYFNGSMVSDLIQLAAGDYVEVYSYASTTLAADISDPVACNFFSGFLQSV